MIEQIKRKELFKNEQYFTVMHNDVYTVYKNGIPILANVGDKWVIEEGRYEFYSIPAVIGNVVKLINSTSPDSSPRLNELVEKTERKGILVNWVYHSLDGTNISTIVFDWESLLREVGCANKAVVEYGRHNFYVSRDQLTIRICKPSESMFADPFWYEKNPLRIAAAKAIVETCDFESLKEGVIAVLDGIKEEFRRVYEDN